MHYTIKMEVLGKDRSSNTSPTTWMIICTFSVREYPNQLTQGCNFSFCTHDNISYPDPTDPLGVLQATVGFSVLLLHCLCMLKNLSRLNFSPRKLLTPSILNRYGISSKNEETVCKACSKHLENLASYYLPVILMPCLVPWASYPLGHIVNSFLPVIQMHYQF